VDSARALYPGALVACLAAVAVALAAAAVGCGSSDESPRTALRITIDAPQVTVSYRVACEPPAGTIAAPRAVCARLEDGSWYREVAFEPPAELASARCRRLRDRVLRVAVRGWLGGRRVSATFVGAPCSRDGGVAAYRWAELTGARGWVGSP
jgi:hypothetical protein